MKKVVMLMCLLMVSSYAFSQGRQPRKGGERGKMIEKMQELTPEQRAELKTKRMTLSLDLTENQQGQVKAVLLEAENNRPKRDGERKKREDISSEEFYQRSIERLDSQIAVKAKLKEILSEEQFEKFEKSRHRKRYHKMQRGMRQGR